jgi:hypothetical protein
MDPSHDYRIEYLPTRQLVKINITVPKDTADPTEYVLNKISESKATLDKSIVKVEISLAVPELKSVKKSSIEKMLLDAGAFNVTGISESKKIVLIKKDGANNIDTKMDVVSAINTYASKYVEESLKAEFIELAIKIHDVYKTEAKE